LPLPVPLDPPLIPHDLVLEQDESWVTLLVRTLPHEEPARRLSPSARAPDGCRLKGRRSPDGPRRR
jgi:hypothetical protein